MAIVLAANYIQATWWHLQIVNTDGNQEIEVQSWSNPGGDDQSNWPSFQYTQVRNHTDNTNYAPGSDNEDSSLYDSVEIDLGGRSSNEVWELLEAVNSFFYRDQPFIAYLATQNSNSYAATLLWMIGINPSYLVEVFDLPEQHHFPGAQTNLMLSYSIDVTISAEYGTDLSGDDFLRLGNGSDLVEISGGSDQIQSGHGTDTFDARGSTSAVTLELQGGESLAQLVHMSGVHELQDFEIFRLSEQDDILNFVNPAGASDLYSYISGGEGNDSIYLDPSYAEGTYVNLTASIVRFGNGSTLVVNGFENVYATSSSDEIIGTYGENVIFVDSGEDTVVGAGGSDTVYASISTGDSLQGGEGYDVFYSLGGLSQFENVGGFEVVVGSSLDETFSASGYGIQLLAGGSGDDTFNVNAVGNSPVVVWGGNGADTISISTDTDQDATAGILVLEVDGLTEENFAYFDLDMAGFGSSFDWSKIDAVIINPDAGDRISVDGTELEVNEVNGSIAKDYYTIDIILSVDGEAQDTSYSLAFLAAWQNAGYQIALDQTYSGTGLEGDAVYEIRAISLEAEISIAVSGDVASGFGEVFTFGSTFLGGGNMQIFGPSGFSSVAVLHEIDGVLSDDGWNDLGSEIGSGQLVTFTYVDSNGTEHTYTRRPVVFDLPWQGYPNGFGNGEVVTFDPESLTFTSDEALGGWFIVGGEILGGQIIANGAASAPPPQLRTMMAAAMFEASSQESPNAFHFTMPEDFSSYAGTPRGGSFGYAGSVLNVSTGDGVLRVSYFVASTDSIVIDGVAVSASNLPAGVLVSEELGNTVLQYGDDDFIVLRGVSLSDWQANSVSQLLGTAASDQIIGTIGNDVIASGAGDDTIAGGAGDDKINYSSGNDVILGGFENAGSDVLDLRGLSSTEATFSIVGNDVLISSQLGILRLDQQLLSDLGGPNSNIETALFSDIILTEAGIRERAILDQSTDQSDTITGSQFDDEIIALIGDDTVYGMAGNDLIDGDDGDDYLDGGVGSDTMSGGIGDDTYIVDSSNDVVIEHARLGLELGGADLIIASSSYVLSTEVEDLTLVGSAAIDGHGNEAANKVTGNGMTNRLYGESGNDSLYGGGGIDSLFGGDGDDYLNGGSQSDYMAGGAGNDTYVVNAAKDVVFEGVDSGIDLVQSNVNWTLGNNIENLAFYGGGNTIGTGNSLANVLTGNNGANTLNGLEGNDTLIGGGGSDTLSGGNGADQFVFTRTSSGIDVITDFNEFNGGGEEGDVLRFDGLRVGTFVYLGASAFSGGSDNSEARVVGNQVLFDANGDGTADITVTLTGLTSASQLAATDFVFV